MTGVAVTGLAPPFRGGIAHYTLHLSDALARRHPTRLFAWYRQYPALLFPGTTQEDPSPMGHSVQTVRSLHPLSPPSWVETLGCIREMGARILVHQWWHPWFTPATLSVTQMAAARGMTVVALCHNLQPHEHLPGSRWAVRRALASARRIVVHGENDAKEARTLWPHADVRIHPHPPYLTLGGRSPGRRRSREMLGVRPDVPLLLFFGCVRAYKGVGDLIEAMGRIRHEMPDCQLIVAGEFYEPSTPYMRMIARMGLDENVTLENGYVPNTRVGVLLEASDVVVLPYRDATGSGVLPMALASGVPVVTTRVGNLPEAMVDGLDGRLAEPRSPADLARAILQVLRERPDPRQIASRARRSTWDGLASTLIE